MLKNLNSDVQDVRFFESSGLFGVDESNKDKYESSDWFEATGDNVAFQQFAYIAAHHYIRSLAGRRPAQTADVRPTDFQLLEWYQTLILAKSHVRVRKSGKGYSVYLPIWYGNIDIDTLWDRDWYRQTKDTLVSAISQVLPEFLDATRTIDQTLPASIIPSDITPEMIDADDAEGVDIARKGIKNLRIVSPACATKLYARINERQRAAWDGTDPDIELTDYEARRYVSALFQSRTVVMFMEFTVDQASAEFICQSEPTLSLLGEYFIRMSEWLWTPDRVPFVHNVVPISKIARLNKDADFKPVPRVDAHNLSVNGKGELLWVPDADNAEFVEQEIENGGMQPNGEWTRVDCVDPENTEYVTAIGADGRTHRMKRPKGNNRLMLTDWHNSRLAYTRDDGNMDVLDLSMFRPAKPGKIADMLHAKMQSAENRNLLSSLGFALDRGKELGIKVEMNPEWFRDWATNARAAEILALINTGNITMFVETIGDLLSNAREDGAVEIEGGQMREFRGQELLTLDDIANRKWFTLDLISEQSPFHPIRALAVFLRKTHERVMVDPGAVFGKLSVRNTMSEMATLIVVVNYAGKWDELNAIDQEERKQYLQPDLAPIDQIEVRDVPFVSGNVALFPHQVKAWNWLKNMPPNLILDVAAGGGKTLLTLLEISYQIGKGMRWPLVVCPDDLVKNYINDAQWLFAGKMNMVVLNNTTFNSKEWGEEKLLQLVQHAPVNTIFLTDYTFVAPASTSKRIMHVMYGTVPMQVSLNNEFLKKISWGGVWMDESHKTKNPFSLRNQELSRLICTIPFKRQLSGTYIADNLTDVVGQMGLMDPQVFGDTETFIDEFFPDGRRAAPKPGAAKEIRKRISQHANMVTIRRKEWAALLPRREDTFYPVEMTPNQFKVYVQILEIQKEALLERAKTDPQLRNALGLNRNGNGNGDEGGAGDEETDVGELLDSKIGAFYLQRLEAFLTAPASDPLGAEKLRGDDLKSPKIAMIEQIVRNHIRQKIPGKIMIWTQYVESAAYTFRNLSPDLQEMCVHYNASDADAAIQEFQTNPNKMLLVGCEKSMNTGHNFQFCSRIIRLETVWNWGTLEQGESRINRPMLDDPRRHENGGMGIFYDWVFCNKSMDVTKNSRMISKLISTIKFYEQDNPHYQALEEPVPITLSKENIFALNDWRADPDKRGTDEDRSCERYFQVYNQYQQLEEEEFRAFREDPRNRTEPYTLEEGEILPGSGLLQRVPYIPQMAIYNAEQLGLVPMMEYISSTMNENGDKLLVDDPEWSPEGMKVHTEFGDCVCRGFNATKSGKPNTIRVTTPSGAKESVPLTMAWVITKETTSGADIRAAIAKKAGAKVDQLVVPKTVKVLPTKDAKDKKGGDKRAPEADDTPEFTMYCETFDNYLSLVVNSKDAGVVPILPELERLGFQAVPPYWYAKINNYRALGKWLDVITTKLEIPPLYLKRLKEDYEIWKKGQSLEKFAHGLAQADRKNFLREQVKPADKGIIKPYLVVHNDNVFLCLNQRVNQQSFQMVRKVAVSGVQWRPEPVANEHWAFFRTKAECQVVMKEMFEKYPVSNKKDLIKDFSLIKLVNVKN